MLNNLKIESIESLRAQIRELMQALSSNGLNLRMTEKRKSTIGLSELLHARVEIYKSIAHRQGMIIEVQATEIKFLSNGTNTERKAA